MIRTKIVATIGPASRDPAVLERLVAAGVDVVRLNFSHGSHETHAAVLAGVRDVARRLGRTVAVLQDLSGPKIRTGGMAAPEVVLKAGDQFTLTSRDAPGDGRTVGLTWPDLPHNVQAGDLLLVADGAIHLRVEHSGETDILCRVEVGGPLGSHKGINLPGRSLNVPILTEKDRADLAFGLAQGVDLVAVSFVRTAHDLKTVRALCAELGQPEIPLVAKIEKHEALAHIDPIMVLADGIMVARGDLGVEIPIEQVPRAQKMLIRRANAAGKPVITATQMLKSMVEAPRPTRAEATDVANAILDGTDAVMLSEETAVGQYPVLAVETMRRLAADVEAEFPHGEWLHRFPNAPHGEHDEAVAQAAVELAEDIGAAAILTLTMNGGTARMVAKRRPRPLLLAMTPAPATQRRLAVVWGVVPLLVPAAHDLEALEREAIRLALQGGHVQPGQPLVITAGIPLATRSSTNLIKVATAEWS
ncbi:MAG TPA: pyruvate kinase [Candidatus Krumholzibacteria bacterium]|nr:pyruvate kinase [Candidatus Krumholzibacteria bacterium]HPD72876.1 pyruvate kinase [Candidatus Krumholzibacteria bacterium]HRY41675.1 pyruvate kinase [Candidatus Krumholzibacteria bacterium]